MNFEQRQKCLHPWLRPSHLAVMSGSMSSLLEDVLGGVLYQLRRHSHDVQPTPNDQTDAILTTATFGEPGGWQSAPAFAATQRFNLAHIPAFFSFVGMSTSQFDAVVRRLEEASRKRDPDPADWDFPGLKPQAYRVLHDQGRRGGPILALGRLLQAQSMCVRVVLVVGDRTPVRGYHFDLPGGHPCTRSDDFDDFCEDIALRIATTVGSGSVSNHCVVGDPIPSEVYRGLTIPDAMCAAGREFSRRGFFGQVVHIGDLVEIPPTADVYMASQYSEGCFASWEPSLPGLIVTVTGNARPLFKGNITPDDLAIIAGMQPDGRGVKLRHIAGGRNDPPSVESVEMMAMDDILPKVRIQGAGNTSLEVPAARSKLHGHRGIASYDPATVEYVPLDAPYFHYLVTCGTEAQARGVMEAFGRSEALRVPSDPRRVIFTILPGHGVMLAEKWVDGKVPFQLLWEYMDAGHFEVQEHVPQGRMRYCPGSDGRMVLEEHK